MCQMSPYRRPMDVSLRTTPAPWQIRQIFPHPPLGCKDETTGIQIYKLGNVFVTFAAWGLICSDPAKLGGVDRGSCSLNPVMEHVPNTQSCLLHRLRYHCHGYFAFREQDHIHLRKQWESALRASPRDFYHFVFAIGHDNARHTAIMEIVLMLEEVKVAASLVVCVISLLLLTDIINSLFAFPKVDMNAECLASIWFFQKLHFPNLSGVRFKPNANIYSLLMPLMVCPYTGFLMLFVTEEISKSTDVHYQMVFPCEKFDTVALSLCVLCYDSITKEYDIRLM